MKTKRVVAILGVCIIFLVSCNLWDLLTMKVDSDATEIAMAILTAQQALTSMVQTIESHDATLEAADATRRAEQKTQTAVIDQAIQNAPPVITKVDFSEYISGSGKTHYGTLYFKDPSGDVSTIHYVDAASNTEKGANPVTLLSGSPTDGTLEMGITCNGVGTFSVSIYLTDARGNKSNRYDIRFTCVVQN